MESVAGARRTQGLQRGEAKLLDGLSEGIDFALRLVEQFQLALLVAQLDESHGVVVFSADGVKRGNLALERAGALENLLGILHIVPEVGRGGLLFQVGDFGGKPVVAERLPEVVHFGLETAQGEHEFFKLKHKN